MGGSVFVYLGGGQKGWDPCQSPENFHDSCTTIVPTYGKDN